ncbi:MAG TPA: cell division protein ZapA [Crocinitomicaceae bacterium]|nr:cell division protein ZapA [Crocinitomicaceae bacterium]
MSEKISIKVVVAGRTYPLNVAKDEDAKVLKAADDINKSIKLLQENYAVKDMQDLLAMTALPLASKSSKNTDLSTTNVSDDSAKYELQEVGRQLEELLTQIQKQG